MGTFEARLGVGDHNGHGMRRVSVLVDTGATYTTLPASLLREELGLAPVTSREFTLADGTLNTLPLGEARLRIGDQEWANVVAFGEEDQYLLGATSLQVFGLVADTTNHRLVPASKLPG